MSGLAEISQRFARIREIRGIMTAMKNLSLVETRKLARFIAHQRRMLANIEAAATDFLCFFPIDAGAGAPRVIVLLIGSERGFCGNFNVRVLLALKALPAWSSPPELIVVGSRLGSRLQSELGSRPVLAKRGAGVIASLEGPTVSEDVPAVLGRMMAALHSACHPSEADVHLYGLAHDSDGNPRLRRLLPLPPASATLFTQPPRVPLGPPRFFAGLLDQYLLASLYGLIYDSLTVENRHRLAHMENALDRLGGMLDTLALKRNALRQEEIIEEIEVMLSSEQAFAHPH
jgi:F-type H+-transporting ATPase subunit gamma